MSRTLPLDSEQMGRRFENRLNEVLRHCRVRVTRDKRAIVEPSKYNPFDLHSLKTPNPPLVIPSIFSLPRMLVDPA